MTNLSQITIQTYENEKKFIKIRLLIIVKKHTKNKRKIQHTHHSQDFIHIDYRQKINIESIKYISIFEIRKLHV